ncbi:RND family transporter [Mycolicibacterium sphagni]|uniref:MMPL family RND transporter n=1 Tax=Mycolicibacterium sphagni TaxID=1786 RepID=A0A255DJ63_9MYCO|nr:RND family transporter [Mycolicibacterium sphagni]OYN79477.1 MMPL family RND transporter [Mycolicibacterium sphagni]
MMGSSRRDPTPVAHWIRRLAIPIILGWLGIVVLSSVLIPPLETVAQMRAVPMSAPDAPSVQAMTQMGRVFGESESDSFAMIVLEGDQPLGADAHTYYDTLIKTLRADTAHVTHVQDFWGDPLTEAAAQSADGKAVYVQLNLAGNVGTTQSNDSVAAVRKAVADTPPAAGVKAYVTGPAALQTDMNDAGARSMAKIALVTFAVIIVILLLFYRSLITVVLLIVTVLIQVAAARGIVAALGYYNVIGLSTFAVNLLVSLAIAAGTDYAIFLVGRYQEARQAGADREAAYYEMFNGTAHVVLGSGLTIAGATYCLSFTRMPYFQSLGPPCAAGIVAGVAVALTLGPAIVTVGSRFGLLEPKRHMRIRMWRKIGAATVRWPGPILTGSLAIVILGLAALPGYRTSYNDTKYIPQNIAANEGLQAADRHFSQARMNPEILMIQADHDLRNPADFLVIDKIAKTIFRVPGIARVQTITRPDGMPIAHTSIPFIVSMQNVGMIQNMKLMKDRMADMKRQADEMGTTVATMKRMYDLMSQLTGVTHEMVGQTVELQGTIHELRDRIADFDDFYRPIRNYLYWEPHCYDIPLCWSTRSIFDTMDGVDTMTATMDKVIANMGEMDRLMPEMLDQVGPMITTMENMQQMMLTTFATMSGMWNQIDELSQNSTAMGKAFDDAKNDDSFYLPPDVFDNPDFQRGMRSFVSPDGKAVRFIISHRGDAATPEGISHVEPIKIAAIEAVKATPLEDATISLAGTAATFKDMADGSKYDLILAGIAALCLIFMIMVVMTRSLVAAVVIVGTVLVSLGASFGLSIIIWQYIFGIELHWLVLAMSVIALLAVGSDYNLLLVSRFKEELPAGVKTGIIRAMGGTGSVVTVAGLVFAATMSSMVVSDLRIIGQIGTTIGLGLLLDTLVVRSFMTPAIAALLGRWFWWPINVIRPRAAPSARATTETPVPQLS